MKNTLFIAALIFAAFGSISFSFPEEVILPLSDLSGKWELQIDNKIDGNITGNNGCDVISFTAQGNGSFKGKYASCPGSNNAKSSLFSAKVYVTDRGTLINIVQDNFRGSQYYASWSGTMVEPNLIRGIWTDVEGNQGEFQLTN